jgi:hypothetical protein
MFDSNFITFDGIATLLSVVAVFIVYNRQQLSEKRAAARTLLLEIRNAERVVSEIRNANSISQATFVMPENNWSKYRHLFMDDLDQDDLDLLTGFYNSCSLIEKWVSGAKQALPISNEEKIRVTQHMLSDLAVKHHGKTNHQAADSEYNKEKREILDDIFYKESASFAPHTPMIVIMPVVNSIRYVLETSCGTKLKKIANVTQ